MMVICQKLPRLEDCRQQAQRKLAPRWLICILMTLNAHQSTESKLAPNPEDLIALAARPQLISVRISIADHLIEDRQQEIQRCWATIFPLLPITSRWEDIDSDFPFSGTWSSS